MYRESKKICLYFDLIILMQESKQPFANRYNNSYLKTIQAYYKYIKFSIKIKSIN